ncbi:hypothetical protein ABPG74_013209 [Tetrahymena malaccensis]
MEYQQQVIKNRFNLMSEYIDEKDLSLLEPVVKCIPTLTQFELSFYPYSRIGKKGVQKISEALSISQNLSQFKLYLNRLRVGNEAIEILSQGISNCLNLQFFVLNLSENRMNSLSFQKLSENLAKCQQLMAIDLDVSQNYIVNDECCQKALQTIFTNIPNLKLFSINFNQNELGTNNKAANLFIYMHRSSKLEYLCLNLDQTNISEEEVFQIGYSIQELKTLKDIQLSLNGNEQLEKSLIQVAEGINSCYNLNRLGLNLGEIQACTKVIKKLYEGVSSQEQLKSLQIQLLSVACYDQNQTVVFFISKILLRCQNLTQLFLSLIWIKILDEDMYLLGQSLIQCKQIQKLQINLGNQFTTHSGMIALFQAIAKCQTISQLVLSVGLNQVFVFEELSKAVINLQNLISLKLYSSCITFSSCLDFSQKIRTCQKLVKIVIWLQQINNLLKLKFFCC